MNWAGLSPTPIVRGIKYCYFIITIYVSTRVRFYEDFQTRRDLIHQNHHELRSSSSNNRTVIIIIVVHLCLLRSLIQFKSKCLAHAFCVDIDGDITRTCEFCFMFGIN